MKKVGLRGKQKKPTSYMSAGEDDLEIDADEQRCARDGLVGACEKLGRGGEEDSFMRGLDLDSLDQQEAMEGQSENVVVEKEKPWLGESQVAAARASQEVEQLEQSLEVAESFGDPPAGDACHDTYEGQEAQQQKLQNEFPFWCSEGKYEGYVNLQNENHNTWAAFRTKIVSTEYPSYTVE